jgi:tripartite-type tricarboxylate transporter receptor subunit TctC
MGQAVIVENKPGAGGALGTAFVAKAKPDGYTLLGCTGSTLAFNAALNPNLPYDPIKNFSPVALIATTPLILAVSVNSRIASLEQLVSAARASPGRFKYGEGAASQRIAAELLAKQARIELTAVPYKGDGPALIDLLGGHIDLLFSTPNVLLPHVQSNRLRVIAVLGTARLAALPGVPTAAEQGIPNSEAVAWSGLCAPAGTPSEVTKRLNAETMAVILDPPYKAENERLGYEITPNSPEEFGTFLRPDVQRAKTLVKDLRIPLEQ